MNVRIGHLRFINVRVVDAILETDRWRLVGVLLRELDSDDPEALHDYWSNTYADVVRVFRALEQNFEFLRRVLLRQAYLILARHHKLHDVFLASFHVSG